MKLAHYLEENKLKMFMELYSQSSGDLYDRLGIQLAELEIFPEKKSLQLRFVPPTWYQAHPEMVHGGLVCTLCDTLAGILSLVFAVSEGKVVYTKNMSIDFLKPVRIEKPCDISASIVSSEEERDLVRFDIIGLGDMRLVSGEAVFAKKPISL